MSLASKMSEVSAECAYVQKTGRNDFHRYNYATAAAVLEKVNEALARRKIAVFPEFSILDQRTVPTKQGEAILATVKARLTLVDGETGETGAIEGIGSGADNGDKAVMKANTAAVKYAWMVALTIATGDDPEADTSIDAATSEPQRASGNISKEPSPTTAPAPAANSSLTFKFGPAKDTPLRDMSIDHLAYYIAAAEKGLRDPSKAQWAAKTRQQLDALKAEWSTRQTPAPARDEDDNIPY
jgi:hypothetical protein